MKFTNMLKLFALSAILPVLYGCQGGALGLGSLIGGASTTFASSGSSLFSGASASTQLASLHNPEPATAMLVGGGMMVMAYFRSRKSR